MVEHDYGKVLAGSIHIRRNSDVSRLLAWYRPDGFGSARYGRPLGNGFWGLLAFTMQMVIVLVAGHVLASSPFFKRLLSSLAGLAKSPGTAIMLVTVVSLIACWINWGFGLVIGALFAKEIAKKVTTVDYRLLIASAYSGFIIWHGGLGGSIPLSIATEDHPFAGIMGVVPTSETIFSTYNLFIIAIIIYYCYRC